jgi:hypothetical protein
MTRVCCLLLAPHTALSGHPTAAAAALCCLVLPLQLMHAAWSRRSAPCSHWAWAQRRALQSTSTQKSERGGQLPTADTGAAAHAQPGQRLCLQGRRVRRDPRHVRCVLARCKDSASLCVRGAGR